jgi:hypothetical protein
MVCLLMISGRTDGSEFWDRFQAEYQQVVSIFEKEYEKGLTVSASVETSNSTKPLRQTAFFSGTMFRVELDRGSLRFVSCQGEQTTFSVAKKDGQYNLISADRNGADGIDDTNLDDARRFYRQHYCVHGFPLLEVVKSSGFRVVKCEKIQSSGEELVRLDFVWKRGNRLSPESVELDFNRNWAIRMHEMKIVSGESFVTKTSYPTIGHFPLESSITIGGKLHRKVKFLEWKSGVLEKEPFSPTYYGIPEQTDARTIWTYIVALVLCGTIGAFIYWIRKRN